MKKIVLMFIILICCFLLIGCTKNESANNVPSQEPQSEMAGPESAPLPKIDKSKLITTKSGLQYIDVKVGTGATPKKGNLVVTEYTGWLEDGTVFDTSRGKEPFTFNALNGEVIKSWDEAVSTMKAGGKRIIVSPPSLAYGEDGTPGGPIPSNATLIFEMELIDVITGE